MKKYVLFALLMIILATLAGCKSNGTNPSVPSPPQVSIPKQEEPKPKPVEENPIKEPTPVPNKSLSWWFTRNQEHQPTSINKDIAVLLAENNAFYILPNNSKKIYLTFDNGYELGYTSKILDTLSSKQVKAAFFITGQFIQTQPELVKRMQSSGHLVCNHTLNHPDLPTLSQEKFNQEINSLEQKYLDLTGMQIARYLRPPMGNYSAATLKWANELGYDTVFWSMAFHDWDPNQQPGAAFSYKHVIDNIHPGAVILLHAVSQSNTEALEQIITDLQAQGYVFSTFI
jgi:peptidoglycan-N-acetylmuramic acid deacetylase